MDDLDETQRAARDDRLMSAFEALATLDAHRIEARALEVLDTLDADVHGDGSMEAGGLPHAARLALFRASVLEVLQDKCSGIAPPPESDIPTWIAEHAPRVAHANIRLLEVAHPADAPRAHRARIELHRLLDHAHCEAVQTGALLLAWWEIETALLSRFAPSDPD